MLPLGSSGVLALSPFRFEPQGPAFSFPLQSPSEQKPPVSKEKSQVIEKASAHSKKQLLRDGDRLFNALLAAEN